MYEQNYNYPPRGNAQKPKKEKINVWEGCGIMRPRTSNTNDIQFYPFKNGGGVIHIFLKCSQPTGRNDENGQPRFKTVNVPVDVYTNATIQEQTLKNVIPGSKIKVVGELATQSFTDKQGQQRSQLIVNAFVFEILELPMVPAQPQYPQPQYPQPQYPQPQYPQPQYPQPQYQQPQYPQPQYQQPQYPQPQYQQPQYPQPQQTPPASTQQYGQYGAVKDTPKVTLDEDMPA